MASNPLHSPIVVSINFPFYWEEYDLDTDLLSGSTIEYVVIEDKPLEQLGKGDTIWFCGNDDWITKTAKEIVDESKGNTDAPGEQLFVYEVWNNFGDEQLKTAMERGWITHQLEISNDEVLLDLLLIRKYVACEYSLDVMIQ